MSFARVLLSHQQPQVRVLSICDDSELICNQSGGSSVPKPSLGESVSLLLLVLFSPPIAFFLLTAKTNPQIVDRHLWVIFNVF